MSSVVISGDTSGAITLAAPSVAGTNTATLPAATGTVMVSGNMPAFSVLGSGSVGFSSSVATKVTWGGTLQWDTASCYSAANNRFTPNVAGYYQVNANAGIDVTSGTIALCWIYKNGVAYKRGHETWLSSGIITTLEPTVSGVVYCNGTTDYIEIYVYCNGTSPTTNSDRWFDATMIRSA